MGPPALCAPVSNPRRCGCLPVTRSQGPRASPGDMAGGHWMRALVRFVVVLAVLAALVGGAAAWMGVLQVPVLSASFGMDHPRDLGSAQPDEAAYASFSSRLGVKLPSPAANYSFSSRHEFSGSVAVNRPSRNPRSSRSASSRPTRRAFATSASGSTTGPPRPLRSSISPPTATRSAGPSIRHSASRWPDRSA